MLIWACTLAPTFRLILCGTSVVYRQARAEFRIMSVYPNQAYAERSPPGRTYLQGGRKLLTFCINIIKKHAKFPLDTTPPNHEEKCVPPRTASSCGKVLKTRFATPSYPLLRFFALLGAPLSVVYC